MTGYDRINLGDIVVVGTGDNDAAYLDSGSYLNAGTITGIAGAGGAFVLSGILVIDGQVTNTGSIGGYVTAAVTIDANGEVINSGSLSGVFAGVDLGLRPSSPVTTTGGTVSNLKGGAISGATGVVAAGNSSSTVTNAGTITGTSIGAIVLGGTTYQLGDGVALLSGGTVNNEASGVIFGARYGVEILGAVGTVTNAGTISSSGEDGVVLAAGGTVVNETTGVISGSLGSVRFEGGAGTLRNSGSLVGGVVGASSLTVFNDAGATIKGLNLKAGGYAVILDAGGSVTNSGDISETVYLSVGLNNGGTVTNTSTGTIAGGMCGVGFGVKLAGSKTGGGTLDNAGIISGDTGFYSEISAATVTNSGTITGATAKTITLTPKNGSPVTVSLGDGVRMAAGGTVTNTQGGVISGARYGVYISGAAGTVTNAGTINGPNEAGVMLAAGGTVVNEATGVISGSPGSVYFRSGGGAGTLKNSGKLFGGVNAKSSANVTNYAGATIEGVSTTSGGYGVLLGAGGSVTNAGAISDITFAGVLLGAGGTVTNTSTGTIAGKICGVEFGIKFESETGGGTLDNAGSVSGWTGFYAATSAATVTNSGTVTGTTTTTISLGAAGAVTLGDGVRMAAGGTVTNEAGGVITGARDGVYMSGDGDITNAGTISGAEHAIVFAGSSDHTLTLQTGSSLSGDVVCFTTSGGINAAVLRAASNALVLQGTGSASNTFENFQTLTVGAGASWTLGGTSTITDTAVSGGALTVTGALTTAFTLSEGGVLKLDAATSDDVTFSGLGELHLAASYSGVISGFHGAAGISDLIEVLGADGAKESLDWDQTAGLLTIRDAHGNTLETLTLEGSYAQSGFVLAENGSLDQITYNSDLACFCAGTRIATANGEVAVEDLRIGDRLLTLEGSFEPVVWIGRSTVSRRFADPVRNLPVRIRAGALGENTPCRDLLLSPDHAVFLDGLLVHAGALINGASIVRETAVAETFVYYHVELGAHAVILADNAPAETFVDTVDRMSFDNWAEHEKLYPNGATMDELPYPRVKAARQAPARLRAALSARLSTVIPHNRAVAA